jgi:hypothetical protein
VLAHRRRSGIIGGTVAGVVVLLLVFFYLCRRRTTSPTAPHIEQGFAKNRYTPDLALPQVHIPELTAPTAVGQNEPHASVVAIETQPHSSRPPYTISSPSTASVESATFYTPLSLVTPIASATRAPPMIPGAENPESDLRSEVVALRSQLQQLQATVLNSSPTPVPPPQTVSTRDAPPPYSTQ